MTEGQMALYNPPQKKEETMAKKVYAQVMIRTISWKSDGGPPPLRLELQHEPVPAPVRRGLLSWLWRPRIEYQPEPLQIPWWSSKADFVGGNSALLNNNRRPLLGHITGDKK